MITRLDHYRTSLSPLGLPHGAVKRVSALIKEVWRRRHLRRMQDLDPRILSDIGVTRADVDWALSLPWTRRAGVELQCVARLRRAALYR